MSVPSDSLAASLKMSSRTQLSGKTTLKKFCCNYEWNVDNFVDFIDRKYEISSPDFVPNPNESLKFKLFLFKGHSYPKGSHVALKLIKMNSDGISHGVKYKIFFMNNKDEPVHLHTREALFRNCYDFDDCFAIAESDLLDKKLLQSGNLIILYEIDVLVSENRNEEVDVSNDDASLYFNHTDSAEEFDIIPDRCALSLSEKMSKLYTSSTEGFNILSEDVKLENAVKDIPTSLLEGSLTVLSDDFKSLYMSKNFSDIILSVDGVEISAHKAVLGARSDYFRKIFKENSHNKIVISDVNTVTMDAVLYYLYTGKIRHLTVEFALNLLKAGKMFRVSELQELIIDFIQDNLSVENVTDVVLVAEDLNISNLKQFALKYVNYNHSEVIRSEKWSCLMKNNPHMAGEILLTVSSLRKHNVL